MLDIGHHGLFAPERLLSHMMNLYFATAAKACFPHEVFFAASAALEKRPLVEKVARSVLSA